SVHPFYLLATEVTEELYFQFLQDNPDWAPTQKSTLIARGWVDTGYLNSWNGSLEPPHPSYPVREVSYFAAKAFCNWLGKKYPEYHFDLPKEVEWEWAAMLDTGKRPVQLPREIRPVHLGDAGEWGLRYILGNVWEWTEDWYAPYSNLFPGLGLDQGVEKVVRGGSFVNSLENLSVSTRGSQPPNWCTPYLGFRVKAVPKEWKR
ncbi:MAG: SUMF1/EgtB/PvdO family nonheme iron enzyme, partial [Spirochaetales bacterium]